MHQHEASGSKSPQQTSTSPVRGPRPLMHATVKLKSGSSPNDSTSPPTKPDASSLIHACTVYPPSKPPTSRQLPTSCNPPKSERQQHSNRWAGKRSFAASRSEGVLPALSCPHPYLHPRSHNGHPLDSMMGTHTLPANARTPHNGSTLPDVPLPSIQSVVEGLVEDLTSKRGMVGGPQNGSKDSPGRHLDENDMQHMDPKHARGSRSNLPLSQSLPHLPVVHTV
mmetsp:Transcript_55094/g.109376  ORF Transcript_55094/g.109376 Transcript_55094/m.109376 type:complete len:224 (-) Transcript_55094:50-721(-)